MALSLERLQAICGGRLQRIGLSATQRPLEEVSHYLAGAEPPVAEVPETNPLASSAEAEAYLAADAASDLRTGISPRHDRERERTQETNLAN